MSKTVLLRRTQVWRRTALVGVLALLLLRTPALTSAAWTDAGGAALESGAAVETPPDSGRWVYTATTAVPAGTDVRVR